MLPGSGVGRKISPLEMEALALAPFPSAERFTPFLITMVISVIAELPMLLAREPLRPVKFDRFFNIFFCSNCFCSKK